MDSHLSNVVKFSLSWGILLLGLCYWMSIPLKFWLKYTPGNVEETYKKNLLYCKQRLAQRSAF